MEKARLLKLSRAVASATLPFDFNTTLRIKPFAGDIGLYQAMSGRPADEVLREKDLLNTYTGALNARGLSLLGLKCEGTVPVGII